jgi:hypothetical protein
MAHWHMSQSGSGDISIDHQERHNRGQFLHITVTIVGQSGYGRWLIN